MVRLMISLANYIQNSGPLIVTRELIDKYYELKQVSTTPSKPTFYDTISKYLNVIQIHIDGRAYICENTHCDPQKLITTIEGAVNHHRIINSHIKDAL